jgi:hypothetical protein
MCWFQRQGARRRRSGRRTVSELNEALSVAFQTRSDCSGSSRRRDAEIAFDAFASDRDVERDRPLGSPLEIPRDHRLDPSGLHLRVRTFPGCRRFGDARSAAYVRTNVRRSRSDSVDASPGSVSGKEYWGQGVAAGGIRR